MPVTRADIEAAHTRIDGHVHVTPVMKSTAFGRPLDFKFEHTQVTGSFKARGAFNSLLSADVHQAATGALDIHPYDAPATIVGQGTCFKEWDAQGLDADTIIIAIGGGGLIGGALAWFADRPNAPKIIGVETTTTNAMHAALQDGPDTDVEVSGLCANALGARRIGRLPYDLAVANNLRTLLLSDDAVADAQKRLWQTLRQLVEPAGAAALAAITSGAYVPAKNEKVAILLCGANPAPIPV